MSQRDRLSEHDMNKATRMDKISQRDAADAGHEEMHLSDTVKETGEMPKGPRHRKGTAAAVGTFTGQTLHRRARGRPRKIQLCRDDEDEDDDDDENWECAKQRGHKHPWTRMKLSQKRMLLEKYRVNKNLSLAERSQLADKLGLTLAKVSRWFYNQRIKESSCDREPEKKSSDYQDKIKKLYEEFEGKMAALKGAPRHELTGAAARLADMRASGDSRNESESRGLQLAGFEGELRSRRNPWLESTADSLVRYGVAGRDHGEHGAIKRARGAELNAHSEVVIDLTNDDEDDEEFSRVIENKSMVETVWRAEMTKLRSWVEDLLNAYDQASSDRRRKHVTINRLVGENNRLRSFVTRFRYSKAQDLAKLGYQLKESQEKVRHLSEKVLQLQAEAKRINHLSDKPSAPTRDSSLKKRIEFLETAYKQSFVDQLHLEQETCIARRQMEVSRAELACCEFDISSLSDMTLSVENFDTAKNHSQLADATEQFPTCSRSSFDSRLDVPDNPGSAADMIENIRRELELEQEELVAHDIDLLRVDERLPLEMPLLYPKAEPVTENSDHLASSVENIRRGFLGVKGQRLNHCVVRVDKLQMPELTIKDESPDDID